MLLQNLLLGAIAATSCVLAVGLEPRDQVTTLKQQALSALKMANYSGQCNSSNAVVRKDWAAFTTAEKKDYINAVLCLQKKPARTPTSLIPGVRTRYDDFVGTHINQTNSIHNTVNFLTWHRYFLHTHESILRDECGYKGRQPYWNWATYADNQTKSPVFDGSDTSLSGDGAYVGHNGSLVAGFIWLPSGNGGGCVKSGPFKDMVVNLGPVSPGMDGMVIGPDNGLGHNPRCLVRDITPKASESLHESSIVLLLNQPTIKAFQAELQGRIGEGYLGTHAGGHYVMNGDSSDFYSSPNDPAFYLHHAMIDQLYYIWQALHPTEARTISGTITLNNSPPSRNGTLNDLMNVGYVTGGALSIRNALSTLDGPFCYIYQ